ANPHQPPHRRQELIHRVDECAEPAAAHWRHIVRRSRRLRCRTTSSSPRYTRDNQRQIASTETYKSAAPATNANHVSIPPIGRTSATPAQIIPRKPPTTPVGVTC